MGHRVGAGGYGLGFHRLEFRFDPRPDFRRHHAPEIVFDIDHIHEADSFAVGQDFHDAAIAHIADPDPISVAAGLELGLSVQPVLMCVAIAAAASFLTPVATPTNLMVMEPAGYKFTDYWKFGLPMMLWFFVVAVFLVPLIWPF